ncbi:gamma-glutamylcyclotransferase family protein [Natronorarus salvus]|uniref:gamma-glutamylcyclotransferase family protein n=1 Tax=Natronorarus salvus TaxID=3117733 RepID=UPI002F26624F
MEVFVYGTLTDPDRVDTLLDTWSFGSDARLRGLRRVEGRYPTLAPGDSVGGRILQTPEIDRLDAYEGVAGGLYVRVELPTEDVALYVGRPDRLGIAGSVRWPGEGPFEERVREYVEREVRLSRRG